MLLWRQRGKHVKTGVLVIGPWKGKGGIVSVMTMHRDTDAWDTTHCQQLSTYTEGTAWQKFGAALKAYRSGPRLIWKAAILHVHLSGGVSCARKLPFIALAWLLRKPVIVHVHAASITSLTDTRLAYAVKVAFRMATCLVALSESWAIELRSIVPDARVVVIPNPVKLPTAAETSSGDKSRLIILFAGKLEQRKGYQLLLQAAQLLIQDFPTLEIWLAGNGDTKGATALAEDLGIKRSVQIVGWVAPQALRTLLRTANIFCLPSFNEGVPMAVLEAMSYSLPVVTTPVGGIPEVISHGENGLLCDVGSVESLRMNLQRLLRDDELRKRLGAQAAMTVDRKCSLQRVSNDLESLYRSLLDDGTSMAFSASPESVPPEDRYTTTLTESLTDGARL